jgi:cellobiose phosphorylase
MKVMPDSDGHPSTRSGCEPYVFTNCYSMHADYFGRSYQSWTTGTSGWALRGLLEGILGVRRSAEGIRLRPAFPRGWDAARLVRQFRGGWYDIRYRRVGPGDELRVLAVGQPLKGTVLPLPEAGQTLQVQVEIGSAG